MSISREFYIRYSILSACLWIFVFLLPPFFTYALFNLTTLNLILFIMYIIYTGYGTETVEQAKLFAAQSSAYIDQ